MIGRLARGEIPAPVAALQLLAASSAAEALAALEAAGVSASEPVRERVEACAELIRRRPEAEALVQRMLATVRHYGEEVSPAELAQQFDAAAAVSAEGASALYALGDERLLAAMTAEVVDWLFAGGWLRAGDRLLEIGSGSGRFLRALAARDVQAVGVDVSQAMAASARSAGRCVVRTSGRDLATFRDGAFDVVLAVDSFPYLHMAGVAHRHVAEIARVLKSGGVLAVLNWRYGKDEAGEGFADAAAAAELIVESAGTQPFALWDGRAFVARKGGGRDRD